MKQFLKYTLATMVGIILLGGLFFLVLLAAGSQGNPKVPDNSFLHLKLNAPIVDRAPNNPFAQIAPQLTGEMGQPIELRSLLNTIHRAKTDEKIEGIFMDLTVVVTGMAKMSEIRAALLDFKTSGKPIVAYSEVFYNQNYYLASVADKVVLNPSGEMMFNGMLAEVVFFSETLKKLGIEMQPIKRGKFKGAVEPYILDELSEANRAQIQTYLNSMFNIFVQDISETRNLSVEEIKSIADDFKIRSSEDAVKYGMVDQVGYRDEAIDLLKEAVTSQNSSLTDSDFRFISYGKYKSIPKGIKPDKNLVAVVYASGNIVSGNGQPDEIGSDKLAKLLRKVRENQDIKAVVLRVDSRGGSALASDVIWRETAKLRETKPLIVSMGDVAASGGYYIACEADTIVAMSNTITGSIGVFGLYPNVSGMLEKIGVKPDYVGTSKNSEFGRVDRPLNDFEKGILDSLVGNIYDQFLTRVGEGRGISVDSAHSLGQGRVWTGELAKANGLIDVLGGLETAIDIAAEKAGADTYMIKEYPAKQSFSEALMASLDPQQIQSTIVENELGEYYSIYKELKNIQTKRGVQAYMPYFVEIK
jgi:protease-4